MKTSKSFIKVSTFLAVVVFLLFGMHYFLYKEIRKINEDVSTKEQNLSLQERRQDYLVSTQKLMESMSADIESVNSSIIAIDGDVNFIENLESVAKNNGLIIDINSLVFKDNPASGAANVTEFRVQAKTSGSWGGTYKFLSQLEALPYKVKIIRFAFNTDVPESGNDISASNKIWKSNFEIVVLKYK